MRKLAKVATFCGIYLILFTSSFELIAAPTPATIPLIIVPINFTNVPNLQKRQVTKITIKSMMKYPQYQIMIGGQGLLKDKLKNQIHKLEVYLKKVSTKYQLTINLDNIKTQKNLKTVTVEDIPNKDLLNRVSRAFRELFHPKSKKKRKSQPAQ